jgi:hypothetical protein
MERETQVQRKVEGKINPAGQAGREQAQVPGKAFSSIVNPAWGLTDDIELL